jgi:predicted nucleic acid-binding protein
MRIVVDTNIVFSALLNTNSKFYRIILQPRSRFNFYATDYLNSEIEEHKDRILSITGYSEYELEKLIQLIMKKIRFINVELIPKETYLYALSLTEDVDIDDTEFIALTEHIKGRFWSGDKELQTGLKKKGWTKFISTNELYEKL